MYIKHQQQPLQIRNRKTKTFLALRLLIIIVHKLVIKTSPQQQSNPYNINIYLLNKTRSLYAINCNKNIPLEDSINTNF